MPEQELEDVMVSFVAGDFDLLLATTIVESGLDIPNANTIFIDEAHRYGLADLHQLRGRVGPLQTPGLLLLAGRSAPQHHAQRRAAAAGDRRVQRHGRGVRHRHARSGDPRRGEPAGNSAERTHRRGGVRTVLPTAGDGRAAHEAMPPKLSIDVDINLPGEAYLPDDYVPDMRLKIDLYRRMTRANGLDQLGEIREELLDRFGPPPEPVLRMLAREELKFDAAIWQIAEIYLEDRDMVFRYTNRPRAEHLARLSERKLRLVDDQSAYLRLGSGLSDPDAILRTAKSVLRPK
jgi:transcription-repair coupling factor (superfamily II helicase)